MNPKRRNALLFLAVTVTTATAFLVYDTRQQDLAGLFGSTPEGAAYNAATSQTTGGYNGSAAEVQLSGQLRHSIPIGQSDGQRISRIARDGATVWTREFDKAIKGLELEKSQPFFATSRSIGSLDPESGETNWRIRLPYSVSGIGTENGNLIVLPGFKLSRPYYANVKTPYTPGAFSFSEVSALGPYQHLRHIIRVEDTWVVADTFAHSVRILDATSGEQLATRAVYFPNMVQSSSDGSIVIAEEHGNRFLRWWPENDQIEVVFGCPHPLFADPSASPETLRSMEGQTWQNDRSVCDARETPDGIFSPNGFDLPDGQHLSVADTDNHRVALFDLSSRQRIGTVTGLNSPIRVIALEDGSN